jgi:hypothetical protein
MTKRARTVLIVIVVSVLAAPVVLYAASFVLLFFWPNASSYLKSTEFDSVKWKEKALDDDFLWPTRLRMVDDLIDNGQLRGASRDEVIRLLGPPDKTEYFKEWGMVYWLGPERGAFRIDSEWLVVRLDDHDVVTEIRIVRD